MASILFWLGILCMAGGFAVCFWRNHPRALRLVSPRSYNSFLALERLRSGEHLIPGTSGFGLVYESLCDICRKEQREVPDINDIVHLELRGLKPGETRTLFIVRKKFESQISLEEMERLVEHKYHLTPAWPSLGAFGFGLLLVVLSYFLFA
jgi:hypothetical protein